MIAPVLHFLSLKIMQLPNAKRGKPVPMPPMSRSTDLFSNTIAPGNKCVTSLAGERLPRAIVRELHLCKARNAQETVLHVPSQHTRDAQGCHPTSRGQILRLTNRSRFSQRFAPLPADCGQSIAATKPPPQNTPAPSSARLMQLSPRERCSAHFSGSRKPSGLFSKGLSCKQRIGNWGGCR